MASHLSDGYSLDSVVVQGLDLRSFGSQLVKLPMEGSCFLGCTFDQETLDHVAENGGLIFPRLPDLPFQPYRPTLYSVEELMEGYRQGVEGSFFSDTRDSKIYQHYDSLKSSGRSISILQTLAQRLHDHAIDDALEGLLTSKKSVIGIMGGHALKRTDDYYLRLAHLSRKLSKKEYFIATGGGPGAMEAGNLGAWFSAYGQGELDKSIDTLSKCSSYKEGLYLDTALDVKSQFPSGGDSLAIPTWFYGHEPTNLFASEVAKYFSNSLREDGLLAIAKAGVVFSPGSAGTVQEIFMDAAQNHYGTYHVVSPMVFFGVEYWTQKLPIKSLLENLSQGKQYSDMILFSDDIDEIVGFIETTPPQEYSN